MEVRSFIYNNLLKLANIVGKNIQNTIPENKQNFPVKINGKTYWISRSCAVAGFIYAMGRDRKWYVLAEKRGKGCPDWNGYWCCPCGYLDFDETGNEAIQREVYEETGLVISTNKFNIVGINFDRYHNQNITVRYKAILDFFTDTWEKDFSTEHMEHDEVEEIKFIALDEVDKYQWAFGHEKLINSVFDTVTFVIED